MYPLSPTKTHRLTPWLIPMALLVVFGLSGCGDLDLPSGAPETEDPQPGHIYEAEAALENHRVDIARQHYVAHLSEFPGDGRAAAGLAITDLLLSAERSDVVDLLTDHLGASGAIDANRIFYDEGGYLYWASRGVRWADDGDQYQGIRSLLADDLPWSSEQLETLTAFVDGLDQPAGEAIRQLRTIATGLRGVDENLKVAIDDPHFRQLYLPGEVFHDNRLTLRLGRSELSVLRSTLAVLRSVIYFVAAYEHQWSLEDAFGAWRIDVDLSDSRHQPGFEPIDYTMEYLDGHLFRSVTNPDRLQASRNSLRNALQYSRDAIHYGIEDPSSTTLQWEQVEESDAAALDELLRALSDALDGPVELPHSTPRTTLDLSPFFEDNGRTLPDDIPWFVKEGMMSRNDDEDNDDSVNEWMLNEDAVSAFATDGVFEPPPEESDALSLELGPDEGYFEVLAGSYWEHFSDVYFATR